MSDISQITRYRSQIARCYCPAGWYVEDVQEDLDEGLYGMKRIESDDGVRE